MDIYALTDEEFDALVDKIINAYHTYCEEVLFEQDKFLYKKISKFHQDANYSLQVELFSLDEDVTLEYSEILDPSSYIQAVISYVKDDQKNDVAKIIYSLDDENSSIVDFLIG